MKLLDAIEKTVIQIKAWVEKRIKIDEAELNEVLDSELYLDTGFTITLNCFSDPDGSASSYGIRAEYTDVYGESNTLEEDELEPGGDIPRTLAISNVDGYEDITIIGLGGGLLLKINGETVYDEPEGPNNFSFKLYDHFDSSRQEVIIDAYSYYY